MTTENHGATGAEQHPAPDSAALAEPHPVSQLIERAIARLAEPIDPAVEAARQERELRQRERDIQQARLDEWESLLCQTGRLYAHCDFGTFLINAPKKFQAAQSAALEACREYAASLAERLDDGGGLLLYGPVGTGKDHLAMAVCRRAIWNFGCHVRWLNGQVWYGELRDAIESHESEDRILSRLSAPQILVLSDPLPPFGELTQHQASWLYRVVERRNSAQRITIATVNVANDTEADKRMGAPTWDRLCHDAWKVYCEWPTNRAPARIINGK